MNQLTKAAKTLAAKYNSTSLILRIAIGLVIGSVLALICPGAAWIEEFGNLFVGPDGRWLVNTIPAVYRAYPFRLARTPGTEQMSVCVDEDGGLIRDAGAGEAFFSPEGEISTSLKPLVELLKAIENGRASLEQAGRALAQAGLLVPWDIKLRVGERDLEVKGAWRVDEGRLRALDDAAFLALRQDGALGIAYAQMLSMNRVEVLARLADWHQKVDQQLAAKSPKNFDQLLQNAKGTLKF